MAAFACLQDIPLTPCQTDSQLKIWIHASPPTEAKTARFSIDRTEATGGSGMLQGIRKCAFGAAAAAALFVIPVSAFSQSVEIGPGGVRVRGGECEQLRRACENKDVLGERGEGNCRRYRETCQRPSRRDACAELRQACLNKDQLGERGEGNCRRYRETCRGRL